MVSNIFYFTPKFGEDEPILTNIFFKWVGSTTNQNMNSFATAIPMISSMRLQSSGLRYRLGTFFSVRPKSGSRICVFETFRVNNKPRGDTNWAKNGSTSTRMDRNMWGVDVLELILESWWPGGSSSFWGRSFCCFPWAILAPTTIKA